MNWHQRINQARERGEFSNTDYTLSGLWVDCACGEQDPKIPRDPVTGEPYDYVLSRLGSYFMNCVQKDNLDEAEATLLSIESRATLLLHRMRSEEAEAEVSQI